MSARPTRGHPSIPPPQHRLLIALLCGALATAVNMAILATLGAARIRTIHGGLLRLLAPGVIRVAHSPGINPTYPTEAQLLFAAGVVSGEIPYRYGPIDGRSLCISSGTPARSFPWRHFCHLFRS